MKLPGSCLEGCGQLWDELCSLLCAHGPAPCRIRLRFWLYTAGRDQGRRAAKMNCAHAWILARQTSPSSGVRNASCA